MERTFSMIKPDGVQRRLVGRILQRFEDKGLRLVGLKLVRVSQKQAEALYSIHQGKPFYESLMRFVTASPVVVMVVEGNQAVGVVRKLLGATFGFNAEPGSIRGDYGCSKGYNLIHGSDCAESAERELRLFFSPHEIVEYRTSDSRWLLDE